MYFFVIGMYLICYLSSLFSYVRTGLALGRIGLSAIRPEFWADSFLSEAYDASCSSTTDLIPDNQTHEANSIRGLCNSGFHCYMNSILQQLFYLPSFKQKILTREITEHSSLSEQFLCDLHEIFVNLADSTHTEAVQPSNLFRGCRLRSYLSSVKHHNTSI